MTGYSRRELIALGAGGLAASLDGSGALRRAEAAQPDPPDPYELGGVVINQLPIPRPPNDPFWPYDFARPLEGEFIASPSILRRPDGTYLAAHGFHGHFVRDPRETRVYRSVDRGRTWALIAVIPRLDNATLFEHAFFVYLLGEEGEGEDFHAVIKRSHDGGSTWHNSALVGKHSPGTPCTPAIHANRIWFSCEGKGAMSAPLGADLLDAASWKYTSRVDGPNKLFPGKFGETWWTEAQIVASPQTGVVVLPKTNGYPYTALIRIVDEDNATFNPAELVFLPGAEKKFACQYDPISEKFLALTNPVLPAHADSGWNAGLIRNTAAILSSRDLTGWSVEKIFLYSPNIDHEGFGYMQFAFDGSGGLAVVARTAMQIGPAIPPRAHDGNLLSFHIVKNFRKLQREQAMIADTGHGRVLRYEANLTTRLAPLGRLTDVSLDTPVGIAQDVGGHWFISEQVSGGRIVKVDFAGHSPQVIATEGVEFTGRPESLAFASGTPYLFMTVAFGDHASKIYRINVLTNVVELFVDTAFDSALGSGTLDEPRGIAIGGNDDLYVSDRASNAIRRFDGVNGTFLGNLTEPPRPQALAWDPIGEQLIFSLRTSDSTYNIVTVALDGSLSLLASHDGLCIGLDRVADRIYWSDYDKDRVYVITNEEGRTFAGSIFSGLSEPGNITHLRNSPVGDVALPPDP